ncbi:MAG: hypothetical protein ACREEP_18820 [Dongiaceae bacterium]
MTRAMPRWWCAIGGASAATDCLLGVAIGLALGLPLVSLLGGQAIANIRSRRHDRTDRARSSGRRRFGEIMP